MREGTESHINGHLCVSPGGAVSVGGCPCRTPRARAEALAARAIFVLCRWSYDHVTGEAGLHPSLDGLKSQQVSCRVDGARVWLDRPAPALVRKALKLSEG